MYIETDEKKIVERIRCDVGQYLIPANLYLCQILLFEIPSFILVCHSAVSYLMDNWQRSPSSEQTTFGAEK